MFHTNNCFLVNIYGWRNTATGKLQRFDGHFKGVINASDVELFTFEFLYKFIRGILDSSQSFRGYLTTAVDVWLKGSESCKELDLPLFHRVQDYAKRVDNESLSRRLQKIFVESIFDYMSLQFQHDAFDAKKDFTCHCHDDCTTPLRIFFLYDNACNVLRYALNRSPETTEEVIWLVDKLHWAGHTTCSPFHDSGAWPFLQGLNTQVAEQKNRITKFLQRSSAYLSWPRQLLIQHFLFRWVNQYQELFNLSLRVPLSRNVPARVIVADGVTVSVRLSEFRSERPYVTAKTIRVRVEPSERLMIGVKGHRDTLEAVTSEHYRLMPLKAATAEPLRAFMRFLASTRPALLWLISFTVIPINLLQSHVLL